MRLLLRLCRFIDTLNDRLAVLAKWAVLASCVISAGNAAVRYVFSVSSNAYLEIQWYLFAACVMLGASQVLRVNEHVRVDLIYGRWSGRTQAHIDLFGLIVFLLPVCAAMLWFSAPLFWQMLQSGEMSNNAGGLIRWPAMLCLPLGFGLLFLQGLSEIVKRVAWLRGLFEGDFHYEAPLQ
ncbi:TRAP-type mannitol/chloroaromatic compound transport system permease small subunit [Inhella inkyongensis]|uniref:TRAP transporter small permease protein n=1 Tax=Inhella inkyongensis TaxID=392593 RepID=A0A840S9L5_9BURK|nr:TRAP transporter small permease subunit [Inhella inkyongensis]MBB5206312.1 TRAP-type mannitol/chloroaromatic compound transport system permease small subunit [Inhella inkyongensis]